MGLFLLDYGAGNVQSLANTLQKLGYEFAWISSPSDFDKATSLIFPGVGAFGSAVDHLSSRGFLEPLRDYIRFGKPYLGICIGMQLLFHSSTESVESPGLAIFPAPIVRLSTTDKSVPHMGWNLAKPLAPGDLLFAGEPRHFYFVHSYCAMYDPDAYPEASGWACTTTKYGQEVFISSVRKGNLFAVQFHPEKSGDAGLSLLRSWLLSRGDNVHSSSSPSLCTPLSHIQEDKHSLTKRIIACMDVRANDDGDLVVTKGDQYDVRERLPSSSMAPDGTTTTTGDGVVVRSAGAVRNLGKPVALAERYYAAGADEICLLNITSFRRSPLHDQPMLEVVRSAAQRVFVPLTIGGGIKDTVDPDGTKRSALEVAGAYFRAGADKVSIGSEAVYAVERLLQQRVREDGADSAGAGAMPRGDGTSAIEKIAHAYGSQAVVVSVDPRRVFVDPATYVGPYADEILHARPDGPEAERGKAWWYQCTVSGGREARALSVVQLAKGAEQLGAGEILLNSIDRDGTGLGFDCELVDLVRRNVSVPVVASSGAGSVEHMVEVFEKTDVEAALAAGIFHRGEVDIAEVKEKMKSRGINVRS